METGGQCAMIIGPRWMLMSLADSLDTLALVCKEVKVFVMFVMTVWLLHRFDSLFQCTLWAK